MIPGLLLGRREEPRRLLASIIATWMLLSSGSVGAGDQKGASVRQHRSIEHAIARACAFSASEALVPALLCHIACRNGQISSPTDQDRPRHVAEMAGLFGTRKPSP